MKKKKKKKSSMIYVYIGIVVILFGGIYALNNMGGDSKLYGMPLSDLNPATRALLDDPDYQNIILPDELDKRIADKDDFFAYMFSSTCIYCKETTPHLVPLVQDMNIDMPMFNVLEFPAYQSKMNIEYTPTLVYYQDGVEVGRMEGGIRSEGLTTGNTIEDYKAFFEKYSGAGTQ